MPKALWNGKVIAESDVFETVEGNVYFPPDTIHREYFQPSPTHTAMSGAMSVVHSDSARRSPAAARTNSAKGIVA